MSAERHADTELREMLKAELRHSAQHVLTILSEAMAELAVEEPDLGQFWVDGEAATLRVAENTGHWG